MKVILFIPVFGAMMFVASLRDDKPLAFGELRLFVVMLVVMLGFVALAYIQTRSRPIFLGMSFGAWACGVLLGLVTGSIMGLVVEV